MSKRGLLRSLYEGFTDMVQRKEVVGRDTLGNTYLRWKEMNQGLQVERREVRWAQPYMFYDPHAIPAEWRMWLKRLRENPPTDEEVGQTRAKAAELQQRVVALEEQERQRRVRQASQSSHAGRQGSQRPDISQLLQQMDPQSATRAGKSGGGASTASEPTGTGEAFQPGTWKPGQ